jgi:hypothetical protein
MKRNILFRLVFVIFLAILSIAGKSQNAEASHVKMLDFKVVKDGNKVEINWTTDKNASTNYFEVEKSGNGKDFKTVALVMGPDPSKTDCDCYGCFDKIKTNSKVTYYRLKHVDSEGVAEFSAVKMIALK